MKHDFNPRRWAHRVAVLVCLAGLGLSASAAELWAPLPGGGWQILTSSVGPGGTTTWAAGASPYPVRGTQLATVAGRAGSLGITTVRGITLADGALAVARCVMGMGPLCGAAAAAGLVYAGYRIYSAPSDGGTTLRFDDGAAQVSVGAQCWKGNGQPTPATCQPSQDALIAQISAQRVTSHPGCTYTIFSVPATSSDTTGSVDRGGYIQGKNGATICETFDLHVRRYPDTTVLQCPASVDPFDGTYSVPANTPPGPDGKCRTARYTAGGAIAHTPVTPEQAVVKVTTNPPTFPSDQWKDAVRDAVETGGQTIQTTDTNSGPATQTGTPTTETTTGPSGTTTTTKTPTYNYTYAPTTVTYTTTTTTQTCVGGGSCTTTTTTPPGVTAPQDPDDPCTANPNRVGCLSLGDPPTDKVPTKAPTLSYTAETVSLPVGCPAPANVAGRSVSYQQICDAATNVKPWLLVGAAFSALMMVVAAIRSI